MKGEGGENFFFLAVVPAGVRLMWKGGGRKGGGVTFAGMS